MVEFSIICVYNDKEILSKFLQYGLNRQKYSDFEKILIDNCENRYDSAAAALNAGAKKANGKYYVFIHQDVRLPANYLSNAKQYLDNIDNIGVAGAAGRRKRSGCTGETVTNIQHGEPSHKAGDIKISKPTEVNELDELILIIPEKIFRNESFSEEICQGWHLYGVEYSLRMRKQHMKVLVLPMSLWHQSDGGWRDLEHDITLLKLINIYPEINCVYTVNAPATSWYACYRLLCNIKLIGLPVRVIYSLKENGIKYTLRKIREVLFK